MRTTEDLAREPRLEFGGEIEANPATILKELPTLTMESFLSGNSAGSHVRTAFSALLENTSGNLHAILTE